MHDICEHRAAEISGAIANHERHVPDLWAVQMKNALSEDIHYSVDVHSFGDVHTIAVDDETDKATVEMEVSTGWKPGQELVRAVIDGKPFNFKCWKVSGGYEVRHRGCAFTVAIRTPRAAELAKLMPVKVPPDTSNLLLCPMPGVIVSVLVEEGDEVQDGQALAIVEAMKMENTLRAERKLSLIHI